MRKERRRLSHLVKRHNRRRHSEEAALDGHQSITDDQRMPERTSDPPTALPLRLPQPRRGHGTLHAAWGI